MNMYDNYRERKMKDGLEFQDYVVDQLYDAGFPVVVYSSVKYQYTKGESRNGIEIKFDDKYKETHNIYIETHEKKDQNSEYVLSGINRDDNTILYVIGNYSTIFIFSKTMLKILEKKSNKKVENHTKTSKGFLLNNIVAREHAIKIIDINQRGLNEWMSD